jgi:diguanylate cyclase (GGDEF)-like protein
LLVCALLARRSKKAIAPEVATLLLSLAFPIMGNLLIIFSTDWLVARIGCYIYYIGLDFAIISLLRFTVKYCSIKWKGTAWRIAVLSLMGIDVIQLLLNIPLGHAFTTTQIMVDGAPYYALVPLAGQTFHRIAVYGVFFGVIGIFAYKTIKAPRIYLERYLVILLAMVFTGIWETYYIFSGAPIDRSMIGFGVFGLLIYVLVVHYKPVLLLNNMLARVVSDLNDAVFFFDRDQKCIYTNEAGRALFDMSDSDDLQPYTENLKQIIGEEAFSLDREWACSRSVLASDFSRIKGESQEGEATRSENNEPPKGQDTTPDKPETLYFDFSLKTLCDKEGRQVGAFLSVHDVTSEAMKLRRERYNAIHDPLTGIYNATYLYEQGERLIRENPDTTYCVIGVDIRQFKLINDIFSKEFGDKVLCSLADNMRTYATPDAVYGRISGDKFGYIMPTDEFDDELTEKRLNEGSFVDHDINYPVIVHMGVYEVDDANLPVSVMFDRAFMAVNSIKNDYGRRVARYDSTMRANAIWNQKISAELDNAIATGQIRPYLQPMVDENGNVLGAEVLVRWIHPEEGFLAPARFVPHFEENGRIAQLDEYMWECACRILKQWEHDGIDLFLSVNISPKDFYFMDVAETINNLVKKHGVNPRKLRLEITETVMMSDVMNRLRILEDLRSAGFFVEMDDFGSGYSSLNMLKDIPVDVLKIDMMFLYETRDQQRAETILQAIINLSNELHMPSITEGVETSEQLAMLAKMGCRLFQGYFFAKPMPVEDFEKAYCTAA